MFPPLYVASKNIFSVLLHPQNNQHLGENYVDIMLMGCCFLKKVTSVECHISCRLTIATATSHNQMRFRYTRTFDRTDAFLVTRTLLPSALPEMVGNFVHWISAMYQLLVSQVQSRKSDFGGHCTLQTFACHHRLQGVPEGMLV